jgi:sucrose-6-phosphate hydrolase SacC (GH32 family)
MTHQYNEAYRPQFHFSPRENWTNDPNGLVFYQGEYHLFFQHNPFGIDWGNMTWGHAISRDLLHWQQLPNALEPDALGTMFSGSAVVDWDNTAGFQQGDEKTLVAIYTAAGNTSAESQGQPFTQCIAYSNNRGRTWTKYAGNPVLGHIAKENRDPKVVWHAPTRRWIMALYLDGNTYALFASPDLKTWTHLHDMDVPGCDECPDFFEMPIDGNARDTRWVFTGANGLYLVGAFDGQRFTPEAGTGALPLQVDYGANYYAVQTYSDIPPQDGRRIQVAWMRGGKYPDMPFNQQMSSPCELTLHRFPEGLRLCRRPVREIERLRVRSYKQRDLILSSVARPLLPGNGDLFDIRIELEPNDTAEVGLIVRREYITYSPQDETLTCLGKSAPLKQINGRIRLHVLVDRTSLEIFANEGRASLTSCFLPDPQDHALSLFAVDGAARVVSLDIHELRSTWR